MQRNLSSLPHKDDAVGDHSRPQMMSTPFLQFGILTHGQVDRGGQD